MEAGAINYETDKILCVHLFDGSMFFISCKKELSCEGCKSNKPPIANTRSDQTVMLPIDSAMPDGSASTDPDGTITSFK